MLEFIDICKDTQMKLKARLEKRFKNEDYRVISEDGFLLCIPQCEDAIPILLTAHMDTVHKTAVKQVEIERHEGTTIITSPQGIGGDDRCGVYMISKLLDCGYKPYVLFCEDEEIGSVGANKFTKKTWYVDLLEPVLYLIELDRRNATDAVFYDCGNEEFKKYILDVTGYKEAEGSFSDICVLSGACQKASVNLSCGYYKEHTLEHWVVWEEMKDTINAVEKLLCDAKSVEEPFSYDEIKWSYGYDYDFWGAGEEEYTIWYTTDDSEYEEEDVCAKSYEEAVGIFLIGHPDLSYGNIYAAMGGGEFYEAEAL